jgi:hypothetical protein
MSVFNFLNLLPFIILIFLEMSPKILILILAVLFINVSSMSFRNHDAFSDKCFYYPVGQITKNPQFNYTVDPAYTFAQ